jgi:hypothetical protein
MAKSIFVNVGPFEMIVNIYPVRQLLFRHLGALDVAKVICAARLEEAVGEKEKERFLNPLRDLFTDAELLEIQEVISEGAAITIWGCDLERLFERSGDESEYVDKQQSSVRLHLAITTFPAPPVRNTLGKSPKGGRQFKLSSFKKNSVTLPGKWEPWTYAPTCLSSEPSERLKLNTPDISSTLIEIPYDFGIEIRSYFSRLLVPSAGILKVMHYGSEDPETRCPCHSHDLQYVNLHESPLVINQSLSNCWSQELGIDSTPPNPWPKGVFKLQCRQTETAFENVYTYPSFRYDRYMMPIRADQ